MSQAESMCSMLLGDRPIAIGDYVRWEYKDVDKWAEGEVRGQADRLVSIMIDTCSDGRWEVSHGKQPTVGAVHVFGLFGSANVRRIPRPESVRVIHCQGYSNGKQCKATTRDPAAITGWRCPEHDVSWCGYFGRSSSTHERPVGTLAKLYDGLTAEQCLERFQRWMQDKPINGVRHRTREGGNRALTSVQLAAARELWSMQLRAKLYVSETERKRREPSVIVDMEND